MIYCRSYFAKLKLSRAAFFAKTLFLLLLYSCCFYYTENFFSSSTQHLIYVMNYFLMLIFIREKTSFSSLLRSLLSVLASFFSFSQMLCYSVSFFCAAPQFQSSNFQALCWIMIIILQADNMVECGLLCF